MRNLRSELHAHVAKAREHDLVRARMVCVGHDDYYALCAEIKAQFAELVPCKPDDPWLTLMRELSKLGVESFYYNGDLIVRLNSTPNGFYNA